MSRSKILPLLAATGLAVALAGCDRQTPPDTQQKEMATPPADSILNGTIDRSHAGDKMPDLTFPDPQGKKLDLASLKGTPVLLNLWATWCAPCKAEMPTLDQIAGDEAGKLRVVTVSEDTKGAEQVDPWFSQQDFKHLEPWLDADGDLGFAVGKGNSVLPTTVLYDAQGKEVWRVVGGFDWSSGEARAAMKEVL
jgi:thiol-disulfide isomerase/thioredoxin